MTIPVPAPAPTPAAPAEPQQPAQEDRRSEVRNVISQLCQLMQSLSQSIFQIDLKEDQVKELAQKVLQELTKHIGEITQERVKQIAGDFLVVEALKKQGRRVHEINSKVLYHVNPFATVPAIVRGARLRNGRVFYKVEVDKTHVVKYGFRRIARNVVDSELKSEEPKV